MNTLRVLWPLIFIATVSGTPAFTKFLTALRTKVTERQPFVARVILVTGHFDFMAQPCRLASLPPLLAEIGRCEHAPLLWRYFRKHVAEHRWQRENSGLAAPHTGLFTSSYTGVDISVHRDVCLAVPDRPHFSKLRITRHCQLRGGPEFK